MFYFISFGQCPPVGITTNVDNPMTQRTSVGINLQIKRPC